MHLFSSVVMISKWRQCRHFRSVRWFLCFSFVAFFFHSPFCIHLYVYYFLLINISIYVRAAVTNVSCHWFLSNEDRHCPSRLVLVSPFLLNDCFRELIILRLCWYRLKCQNSFPFIFCWFKEYIFFKPDLFQAGSRISELRITEWKATIIFRHRCSTVAPTFLFLSFLLLFIFFSYCFFFARNAGIPVDWRYPDQLGVIGVTNVPEPSSGSQHFPPSDMTFLWGSPPNEGAHSLTC